MRADHYTTEKEVTVEREMKERQQKDENNLLLKSPKDKNNINEQLISLYTH